jgi:hypothetical protein
VRDVVVTFFLFSLIYFALFSLSTALAILVSPVTVLHRASRTQRRLFRQLLLAVAHNHTTNATTTAELSAPKGFR